MAQLIDDDTLSHALLDMVRALAFDGVADKLSPTGRIQNFPSIDLAVVAFPQDRAPVAANVLFSREYPQGVVAAMDARTGALDNIRFDCDQRDADGESVAWRPGSDWSALHWTPLAGSGEYRFVAPYAASLIKVMVAVGVCLAVDRQKTPWDAPWTYQGRTRSVTDWCESMIVSSNNDATSAMVALLHASGVVEGLNARFAAAGLSTLQLNGTRTDGGWRNADGAGVGALHMTAWDTARLLWLLSDNLPAPTWLASDVDRPLSASSRARFWGWMADQGLHEILSSTAIAGVSGWECGIPAELPWRWIRSDGSVLVEDIAFEADVRAAQLQASVRFAHKTGTTDTYASDAGVVRAIAPGGRRYLVAMTTTLGRRFAPRAQCATDWRLPRLGAQIDAWMRLHLE